MSSFINSSFLKGPAVPCIKLSWSIGTAGYKRCFCKSTGGDIVIWWNLNGVIVSFSHKWGEIVKQVMLDCKVTSVIEMLKENRCYWDFPFLNYKPDLIFNPTGPLTTDYHSQYNSKEYAELGVLVLVLVLNSSTSTSTSAGSWRFQNCCAPCNKIV